MDNLKPATEGISWTDLNAEEQRAIAILGAGLSIELCDAVALLKLRRLGLIVGSHLTATAHELRRRVVLDELRARNCS
ncbi:hypothetical protein XH98_13960 [Bradyrhizobium sp. CCBAU 51745]|nr:hypothetical protein [Bradyrhizobium sp. CCBAU 51745]